MACAGTSFVRTVLGAISAGQLGVCHALEHIGIGPSFTTHETPDFLLDRVDRGVEELRAFHAAPCQTDQNRLRARSPVRP